MADKMPPTSEKQKRAKPLRKKFQRKLEAQAVAALAIGSRAHARELPPPRESPTADKVAHCVRLMIRGQWRGYLTRHQLSEAWGYSDDTVSRLAAEASRRFKLDPEQIEQEKIAHAMAFERIERRALRMCSHVTGLPDFANAIKARLEMAHFQGIADGPKRLELTGKDGGPIEARGPVIMVPPEIEE
jgi:hypothetical protein